MKTRMTIDQILYGNGAYVSALPVLMMSVISDTLNAICNRLIAKFNRHK